MRKSLIASTIASVLLLSACSSQQAEDSSAQASQVQTVNIDNVLMKPSPLQYMAPEFDKFGTKDYEPSLTPVLPSKKHRSQQLLTTLLLQHLKTHW